MSTPENSSTLVALGQKELLIDTQGDRGNPEPDMNSAVTVADEDVLLSQPLDRFSSPGLRVKVKS